MKAGESPLNQGRSVKAAPVRFLKAVSRSEEKRRSGAPRGERPTSLGVRRKAFECYPRLSALRSPHICEGAFPRERGDGKSRRSPRLAKTGAAELWVLARAGCGTWIGHPVRTRGRQRRTPMRVKNCGNKRIFP